MLKFKRPAWNPIKIALGYILAGALWILFSDHLLDFMISNPDFYRLMQMVKGWLFILITGIVLYLLIRKNWNEISTAKQEISSKERSLILAREQAATTESMVTQKLEEVKLYETRFLKLYNSVYSGVLIQNGNGEILHANEACLNLLGLTFQQLKRHEPVPLGWKCETTYGPFDGWRSLPQVASNAQTQIRTELVLTTASGSKRWLMIFTDPPVSLLSSGQSTAEVYSIILDITERKQAEIFESVLQATNHRILSHKPLDLTLNLLCEELVSSLGFLWAMIAMKEPNHEVSFRHMAGVEAKYLAQIKARWDDSPLGNGAVGKSIKTGKTQIFKLTNNSAFNSWPFISEIDAQYVASFPLKTDNEVLGTLLILTKESGFSNSLHLAKLENFAHQVAIAITFVKNRLDLTHRLYHDALSGLPNRTLFNDRLRQSIALANRRNHLISVLFLDIDRFKLVNDTMGHEIGDNLLINISNRLKDTLREGDSLARQGGDEFLIILPEIRDKLEAGIVARRILESLTKPFFIDNREILLTGSIGISVYPHDGENADSLVKNADSAMYFAKDQGRNNYQFFTKQMNATAVQKLTLDNSLRKALDKGEFEVFYQPQVDLKSGEIIGCEALCRWNSPTLGMVSPSEFIPIAEENGMIIPLGDWVLRSACSLNKSWQDQGYPPIRVSVNLSGRQFRQKEFFYRIASIIKETGLNPHFLELEITESTAMENLDLTAKILRQLKDAGIRISIDDFGMGFSSLNYLRRLPLDSLKIDQAFINDINPSQSGREIINAIIHLAHTLKLSVVAEGVETREQLVYLKARDCDEMQGYLFSKPIPAKEMELMLKESRRLRLYSYSVK